MGRLPSIHCALSAGDKGRWPPRGRISNLLKSCRWSASSSVLNKETEIITRTSTTTFSISINATARPGHPQRPHPNTSSVCLIIAARLTPSASHHRCGRNTCTSSPYTALSRTTAHVLCPMRVPAGSAVPPPYTSPPGPTAFMMSPPNGGCMRRPSHTTACKKGRARVCACVAGDARLVPVLRSSAWSAAATSGCVAMWRMVVLMAVAVVSAPAMMGNMTSDSAERRSRPWWRKEPCCF